MKIKQKQSLLTDINRLQRIVSNAEHRSALGMITDPKRQRKRYERLRWILWHLDMIKVYLKSPTRLYFQIEKDNLHEIRKNFKA